MAVQVHSTLHKNSTRDSINYVDKINSGNQLACKSSLNNDIYEEIEHDMIREDTSQN